AVLREEARARELDLAVAAVGLRRGARDARHEVGAELGERRHVERLRAELVDERGERRVELARPLGERVREPLALRDRDAAERLDEPVAPLALRGLEEERDHALPHERVALAADVGGERRDRAERLRRLAGRDRADRLDGRERHRGLLVGAAEVLLEGGERQRAAEETDRLRGRLADEGLLLVQEVRDERGPRARIADAAERADGVAPHEAVS